MTDNIHPKGMNELAKEPVQTGVRKTKVEVSVQKAETQPHPAHDQHDQHPRYALELAELIDFGATDEHIVVKPAASPTATSGANIRVAPQLDFVPPNAAPQLHLRPIQTSPVARSPFTHARSAVYAAAMVVLTSGDFLAGAHSQEADTLNAIWTASTSVVQMEMVAAPGALAQEAGAYLWAQPPESASQDRVSGLVMPPDSATPKSFAQEVPAQNTRSLDKPSLALPSQAAGGLALAPRGQTLSREGERLTVALVDVPSNEQQKPMLHLAASSPLASAQSAMDKSTNEAPSRATVVSSIGTDPDRYNASSWTSMQVSGDLPPKIAALGEDLISVVQKEIPGDKRVNDAMPFDEFKLRVKEAVVASPDVGIVSSQLGQSQSGKSIAYASMLPQVTGTADSGKRNIGRDPYLNTPSYSRNGVNYGITVSQLLFDFGASLFGFRAGEARVVAAQELLNSKRSEQALKSISAFVELERAKAQMVLAKQNASSRLAIVKLVKERSEIGGGTKADIIRVESKYAEALSTISLAETRLANAEEAYRELFGSSPKGVVHGPLHEFAISGLNKTAEELAGTYPGLLQLAKLRDASQADYNSAVAKTLPSFQLVYGNTVNGLSAPSPIQPSRNNSLVVQLKYEFYTGGADTARKNDAIYKTQQAAQEFESGMRQYQKVLRQSQAEIRNNDELIAARKVSAVSAIDSMRAVREQFSFNKGSLLDLITVQESLYMSGRDLIDATSDRALVRYRLLHLTAELDKMFELNTLVSLNTRD